MPAIKRLVDQVSNYREGNVHTLDIECHQPGRSMSSRGLNKVEEGMEEESTPVNKYLYMKIKCSSEKWTNVGSNPIERNLVQPCLVEGVTYRREKRGRKAKRIPSFLNGWGSNLAGSILMDDHTRTFLAK